jgi:predicted ABC-type ATPase
MKIPRLRLVAGPNGAGKSTFTEKLLKEHVNLGVYVNPDEIAATLIGDELSRAKEAQQIAIRQREQLLCECQSMTYESVMSHHSHLDFLKRVQKAVCTIHDKNPAAQFSWFKKYFVEKFESTTPKSEN